MKTMSVDMKNNIKVKKTVCFKILTQVFMWDDEQEVKIYSSILKTELKLLNGDNILDHFTFSKINYVLQRKQRKEPNSTSTEACLAFLSCANPTVYTYASVIQNNNNNSSLLFYYSTACFAYKKIINIHLIYNDSLESELAVEL